MTAKESDALYQCPRCGLKMNAVKTPGIIDPWDKERISLMALPCSCTMPIEIFRHARRWLEIVSHSNRVGSKSGNEIRLEYSGEGLGPMAGDFDQIVMYDATRAPRDEVCRYNLADVHRPEVANDAA